MAGVCVCVKVRRFSTVPSSGIFIYLEVSPWNQVMEFDIKYAGVKGHTVFRCIFMCNRFVFDRKFVEFTSLPCSQHRVFIGGETSRCGARRTVPVVTLGVHIGMTDIPSFGRPSLQPYRNGYEANRHQA